MSDTTDVGETVAADADNLRADLHTSYAWGDEPEDEPAAEWIPTGGNRLVVAVAVLAAVGAIAAIVAAAVALTAPKPEPSHYSIRPPVEVVPPPAPRPPPVTTTVTAAAPPVAQPPPLTASDRFDLLLEKDGMVTAASAAENDREGRRVCQLVADGVNPAALKGGGDDVDPAHGRLVVRDTIAAYCPQYAGR